MARATPFFPGRGGTLTRPWIGTASGWTAPAGGWVLTTAGWTRFWPLQELGAEAPATDTLSIIGHDLFVPDVPVALNLRPDVLAMTGLELELPGIGATARAGDTLLIIGDNLPMDFQVGANETLLMTGDALPLIEGGVETLDTLLIIGNNLPLVPPPIPRVRDTLLIIGDNLPTDPVAVPATDTLAMTGLALDLPASSKLAAPGNLTMTKDDSGNYGASWDAVTQDEDGNVVPTPPAVEYWWLDDNAHTAGLITSQTSLTAAIVGDPQTISGSVQAFRGGYQDSDPAQALVRIRPPRTLAAPTNLRLTLDADGSGYTAQWDAVTTDADGNQLPAGTQVSYRFSDGFVGRIVAGTSITLSPLPDRAVIDGAVRATAVGHAESAPGRASLRIRAALSLRAIPDHSGRRGVEYTVNLHQYLTADPNARVQWSGTVDDDEVVTDFQIGREGLASFTAGDDGDTTVAITAIDQWGQSATRQWRIVIATNSPPTWDTQFENVEVSTSATRTIAYAARDEDNDPLTFSLSHTSDRSGAAALADQQATGGNIVITGGLGPEEFDVTIGVTDGHAAPVRRTFTVTVVADQNQPPTISLVSMPEPPLAQIPPATDPYRWQVDLTASATDPDGPDSAITYAWSHSGTSSHYGLRGAGNTRRLTIRRGSVPRPGSRDSVRIIVVARDGGGAESVPAERYFALPRDTRLPPEWRTDLTPEIEVGVNEDFALDLAPYIVAGFEPASSWTFSASSIDIPSVYIDGSTLRGTSPARSRRYEATATVRDDRWPEAARTVAIMVRNRPNRPPTIEPIADLSLEVDESRTVDVRASDPDGDSFTIAVRDSAEHARATLIDDGARVRIDHASQPEEFTVRLEAEDEHGAHSAPVTFTVRVLAGVPPTVSLSGSPILLDPGDAVDLTAVITERAAGLRVSWAYSQRVLNDAWDDGTFDAPSGSAVTGAGSSVTTRDTWTAPGARPPRDMIYRLVCRAQDEGGRTGSGHVDVTVRGNTDQPNRPPVWQTVPVQRVARNATVTVDLSAYCSDPDGDAIIYLVAGSPILNLRLRIVGAELEIRDFGAAPRLYAAVLRAQDGKGAATTTNVGIIVEGGPPLP